jgi:K+-transporting ATPase c subunit
MKKNLITAVLMTLATSVLFGLLFPLLVTGLADICLSRLFPLPSVQRGNRVRRE